MPDIGYFHPQLVHFAVVLAAIGVAFRVVSLTGRARWTHPAAIVVLLAAALATVLTAKSGDDAHSLPERIPGARQAVVDHETWGERTRNIFLVVAGLELIGLALAQRKAAGAVRVVSALVGAGGLFALYEAAEHGGEVVYSYAGGIGTRSGDSADVTRLLIAGLYHQAAADRRAGRNADAARLVEELARRRPGDPVVALMAIESRLDDRQAAAALAELHALPVGDSQRLQIQHKVLLARAYAALAFHDSALAVLGQLRTMAPNHPAVEALTRSLENR
jgi:uncharacterized membrane protein